MQKALVEEDDPDSLGDETIHHDVYEKIHPDANVRPNQVGVVLGSGVQARAVELRAR